LPRDLTELVEFLRRTGGDTADVEVKAAAGGFPASLTKTLSALANLPGGGTVLLGVDENADFAPVELEDPQALKRGLASKARSFVPPVGIDIIDEAVVEGRTVVAAIVRECDPSAKPCRVGSTGKAYLRSYDGDFELSLEEERGFLSARTHAHFDRLPVEGASIDDLDGDLLHAWQTAARDRSPQTLGRFDDEELLRRTGVLLAGGVPSRAAILALGRFPQQWFPRFVVQVAAEPRPDDPPETRARNARLIDGPIPVMLEGAMDWARATFTSRIVGSETGAVRDVPEYPLEAFRELVANALVHRDLDTWSEGYAVEVRLREDRLVVANPGGLFGITVDRLGKEGVTSARNAWLVSLCRDTRLPRDGSRVIEALSTGLTKVASELDAADLPPPVFYDAGIRFTVLLRQPARTAARPSRLRRAEARVYDALPASEWITATALVHELGLSESAISKALRGLVDRGIIRRDGGPGRATTYRRLSE
jgi:ATP-dependent DNA helicase RecG